jgi:hypothetical protein
MLMLRDTHASSVYEYAFHIQRCNTHGTGQAALATDAQMTVRCTDSCNALASHSVPTRAATNCFPAHAITLALQAATAAAAAVAAAAVAVRTGVLLCTTSIDDVKRRCSRTWDAKRMRQEMCAAACIMLQTRARTHTHTHVARVNYTEREPTSDPTSASTSTSTST